MSNEQNLTYEQIIRFIEDGIEPDGNIPGPLRALWFDALGEWDKAHSCVQDATSGRGAHIHAYLHRKEGDNSNARYWYHRAGEVFHGGTLEEEWRELVELVC